MMYLSLIACLILIMAFVFIVMNVIISILKTKENERILWKMENMTERDKVVTRTGGLARDRIYEKSKLDNNK